MSFLQQRDDRDKFGRSVAEYSCEKCKSQKVVMRKAEREFRGRQLPKVGRRSPGAGQSIQNWGHLKLPNGRNSDVKVYVADQPG